MSTKAPGPIFVLRGHSDEVSSLSFTDSDFLISGSCDGELRLWKLDNRSCSSHSHYHRQSVISTGIATSCRQYFYRLIFLLHWYDIDFPHLRRCHYFSHSRDGCILIWDTNSFSEHSKPIQILNHGSRHFCNASIDKIGNFNLLVHYIYSVEVWHHSDFNVMATSSFDETHVSPAVYYVSSIEWLIFQ